MSEGRISLLEQDGKLPPRHLPAGLDGVVVSATAPTLPLRGIWLDTSLRDQNPPAELANVLVTPRQGGLRVRFDEPADLDLREIQYRIGPSSTITSTPASLGQTTDALISGLTDGVPVWVQLRAVDTSLNAGPWTAAVQRTPQPVLAEGPLAMYDAAGLAAGPLAQWNDLIGGYHLTPPTTAATPVVVAATQNNLPVVRFDGVNDVLANTVITPQAGTAGTQILVARFTGDLTPGTGTFFSSVDTASTSTDFRKNRLISGGKYATVTGSALSSHATSVDNTVHVVAIAGNTIMVVDDITTTFTNSGTRGIRSFQLATDRDRNLFSALDVAQVVLYNRTLDPLELAESIAALRLKWGI